MTHDIEKLRATTQCWACDRFYQMPAEQCPKCGAANANCRPELAKLELARNNARLGSWVEQENYGEKFIEAFNAGVNACHQAQWPTVQAALESRDALIAEQAKQLEAAQEHMANAVDNLSDLPINDDWAERWADKAMQILGAPATPAGGEAGGAGGFPSILKDCNVCSSFDYLGNGEWQPKLLVTFPITRDGSGNGPEWAARDSLATALDAARHGDSRDE